MAVARSRGPAAARPARRAPRKPLRAARARRARGGAAGRPALPPQGARDGAAAPTVEEMASSDEAEESKGKDKKRGEKKGGKGGKRKEKARADDVGSHEKIKLAWREARDLCQPTQAALGWDWCLSKLKQYTDESAAQRFMDRKPVPYVSRGRGAEDKTMYILDHHHTLCALELSGWEDVEVTFELVHDFDGLGPDSEDSFWGFLSGRGWTYLLDEGYQPISWRELPTSFDLRMFRNDVYRSMGGFARKYGVLERGSALEDKLFFEFRWGYLFWYNRHGPSDEEDDKLWRDERHYRMWNIMQRTLDTIVHDEFDVYRYKPSSGNGNGDPVHGVQEGELPRFDIAQQIEFAVEVVQPCYRALSWALQDLCESYASDPRAFGSLTALFPGTTVLPGRVLTAPPPEWSGKGSHTAEMDFKK